MNITPKQKDLIKLKSAIWNIPPWKDLAKLTWSKIHKYVYTRDNIYSKQDVYQDTYFMYLKIVLEYDQYKITNNKKRPRETQKECDIRLFKQYYSRRITYELQNLWNRKLRIQNEKQVDVYDKIIDEEAKEYVK